MNHFWLISYFFLLDLTWSAVANNPDTNCNPGLAGIISGDKNKVSFDKTSIVGLVIWMFCVLYSSLRSASAAASLSQPDPERQGLHCSILLALTSVSLLPYDFSLSYHCPLVCRVL
jgi:hypothetical protein